MLKTGPNGNCLLDLNKPEGLAEKLRAIEHHLNYLWNHPWSSSQALGGILWVPFTFLQKPTQWHIRIDAIHQRPIIQLWELGWFTSLGSRFPQNGRETRSRLSVFFSSRASCWLYLRKQRSDLGRRTAQMEQAADGNWKRWYRRGLHAGEGVGCGSITDGSHPVLRLAWGHRNNMFSPQMLRW